MKTHTIEYSYKPILIKELLIKTKEYFNQDLKSKNIELKLNQLKLTR